MKRLLLLILIMLPTWLIGQTTIKTNFVINKAAPTLTLIGTGGVINFNSDILFRHSLNTITLEGGNLSLGTNSLLTTGSLGSTGSRILKGWFADLDVSNLPTFNGVSLLYGLTDTITKSFTTVSALNTLLAAKQDTGVVSMTYPAAGIALSTGSAWGTSITNSSANWNTAYSDRLKWDGGSTGLVAADGRTNLGATTVGTAFFTMVNPSAIRVPIIQANNTITNTATTGTGNVVLSASPTLSGTVALGTGSLTMTGSLAASGSRVLKGWFTDLEVTNLPTVNGATLKSALSLTSTDVGLGNVTNKAQVEVEDSSDMLLPYILDSQARKAINDSLDARIGGGTSVTDVGEAFITLVNPTAVTFPQINANNSVSALTASAFTTAIGASHVYSDTMDISAGVIRIKATTITTEPYSVQIFSSGGKDITHAVQDSMALNGGVYKLYVYSVDALSDTKVKILY
jgi:hypothetical protein